MSSKPSPHDDPRRRTRAPSPSYFGSGEFQRILWFAGILAFLTLFAWYVVGRPAPPAEPLANPAEQAPLEPLSPAVLEAHRVKLLTLFEGALIDTNNGDDFKETAGYRRLLQILSGYTPEAVHERATRWLDHQAFLAQPDAHRGEFVRARGVMSHMFTEKLQQPVFGIRDVYRGFLAEADGSAGVIFDLPTPPPSFDMRRDAVDIEGIYYRTVRYENQRGEFKEVPYVLARNMQVVASAPVHHTGFLRDNTGLALVGIALAILGVRLLMYWAQRRKRRAQHSPPARPPDFRDMFDAKQREMRRKSGEPPPTPSA